MKNPVVIMNFSGVYEKQNFYKSEEFQWVDCKNIAGTNCYCDEAAKTKLRKAILNYPPGGIHYIDSGNYHYVTKLWTEKINEPFSLLLFDHHTDMQPAAFGNVLSCGSWVKDMLDTCSNLVKVYLMGADEKYTSPLIGKYTDRLVWYSEKDLMNTKKWDRFKNFSIKEALYISIDKDLLSRETVITNWDQGNINLENLIKLITAILENHRVIGMDVNGECAALDGEQNPKLYQEHDKANHAILHTFLKHDRECKLRRNIK